MKTLSPYSVALPHWMIPGFFDCIETLLPKEDWRGVGKVISNCPSAFLMMFFVERVIFPHWHMMVESKLTRAPVCFGVSTIINIH